MSRSWGTYPSLPFITLLAGALMLGDVIKEHISSLRKFRLRNMLMVQSMLDSPCWVSVHHKKADSCMCRRDDFIGKYY